MLLKVMHNADLAHSNRSIQDKLEEIYALRRTRSKVNWDRDNFLKLLDDFGNPHLDLPPVIHVAGTNGKGSVIAMLRSILQVGGYKVHAFTSPHLIHVNERIVLDGAHISDEKLSDLIDQALQYADGAPLSFFEIITAIAFRAFSDVPADVLLLEVGMGGRLDSTNVIQDAIATVINRVSMDHTEFLGERIELIAAEKAGIMKSGVPCVVGRQTSEVHAVLEKKAKQVGAQLILFDDHQHDILNVSLHGCHQIDNARLVCSVLDAVQHVLPVTQDSVSHGFQTIDWPARLQPIHACDIGLSEDSQVWLDAGHNDSAGKALASFLEQQELPIYLILGMLKRKKVEEFLEPMRKYIKQIYVVPLEEDESFSADDIEGSISAKHYKDAIHQIRELDKNMCVLIGGSVYLAGQVLKSLHGSS